MNVFALPDLGEGLTDAELVRWLVAVGDTIAVDQPIAEVETAKSVVEVPSPFAGIVAVCHGEEGETIMVGSPLLEVEEVEARAAEPTAAEPVAAGSGQVLVGYGTTDHATARRRGRAALRSGAPAGAPSRVVPVVSPVVRALAHTHGVDLASLTPTGAGGVVTRRDLEAAPAAAKATASSPPPRPPVAPSQPWPSPASSAPAPEGPAADGHLDPRTGLRVAAVTPFSRLRRTVAETMTRSRSEIPEATVWVDVDATELWEARRALGRAGRPPSMLAFVARFALSALARHPELAGRVTAAGDAVETFDGVNLGFAADTPRGLLVPVIRGAGALSVRDLDAELGRLAGAAREGALPPADRFDVHREQLRQPRRRRQRGDHQPSGGRHPRHRAHHRAAVGGRRRHRRPARRAAQPGVRPPGHRRRCRGALPPRDRGRDRVADLLPRRRGAGYGEVMSDKQPDDGPRGADKKDDDYDLDFEKELAPEENIPWLPHPEPSDGEAPAP